MVNKLRKIIGSIEKEFGPLSLFAIFKMDEIVDKWSLIVAADWMTAISEEKRNALFKRIFDLTTTALDKEENASIARFGLFGTQNHFVQELKKIRVDAQGEAKINDTKVNGNWVHEGIILKS